MTREPNPHDPCLYWNKASISDRSMILDRAQSRFYSPSRFPLALRLDLAARLPDKWESLTLMMKEFLYLGLYDGIDCDTCDDFIPDVPDMVDRIFVTADQQTVCERCFERRHPSQLGGQTT